MEELIEFFKDEASNKALIYQNAKFTSSVIRLGLIACIFLVFSLCIVLLSFVAGADIKTVGLILLVILVLFIFCLLVVGINAYYFERQAKQIINQKYGIEVKEGKWKNREFMNYQQSKLIEYFKLNKLYSFEKLKHIIESLREDINKEKISRFSLGILSSFLLIIFTQVVAKMYRSDYINVIVLTMILVGCCIIATIFIVLIKLYTTLLGDLQNNDRNAKKELLEYMEEIILKYEEKPSKSSLSNYNKRIIRSRT